MSANPNNVYPIVIAESKGFYATSPKRNQSGSMTVTDFRVWLLRRRRRESLGAIAVSLGVTAGTVWDWIHGRRNPSGSALLLAAILRRYSQVTE